MDRIRALVLGSGGSRGALQVGAIRALFETGYVPDLLTGASIGAANAAFLALHGFTQDGINKLQRVWETAVSKNLLPTNLGWQIMRAFFRRTKGFSQDQILEFAITNGLTPDLKFRDLKGVKLYPVAADLDAGQPFIFGEDPDESVLQSVLASMALPPWLAPVEREGHVLIDGGAVSCLPIEAALLHGATEIIALDIADPIDGNRISRGIGHLFVNLDKTVENRHKKLEMELAEARGIPLKYISLYGEKPVPIWDFGQTKKLIERGYQLTCRSLVDRPLDEPLTWISEAVLKRIAVGVFDISE